MIGLAPQMTAPWTAFSPTPPAPMTTTLLSGGTLARLTTAPKPVSDPAGQQRGEIHGEVFGDLDQLRLVHQNVLGESAHPGLLDDALALLVRSSVPSTSYVTLVSQK